MISASPTFETIEREREIMTGTRGRSTGGIVPQVVAQTAGSYLNRRRSGSASANLQKCCVGRG